MGETMEDVLARQNRGEPALAFDSRRSTIDSGLSALIANEMHGRKGSTRCKERIYQILIANEFRYANFTSRPVQAPKLLDFVLGPAKSATSDFLIDNFGGVFSLASSFEPLASRTNRPYFALCNSHLFRGILNHARAEMAQSHRRHGPRLTGHWSRPFLIANGMHRREESSTCKQSTYEFLIANEFQCYAPRGLELEKRA